MTIQKAREILGDKTNNRTDEEILMSLNTLTIMANLAIDAVLKET